MNKKQAYLMGANMVAQSNRDVAQSNRDLGNLIAKSNKEYNEKLEEISKAEIKSKNRVDISLEEYETMKKQIEWLEYEVYRLQNIMKKIEIPYDLDIIPDSIETTYCDDHLNFRKIFNIRFAVDDFEIKKNCFY